MNLEKVTEQSMDNFWSHYEAGHFDKGSRKIAQLTGDNEVVQFVLDPDSYYMPNRRGDSFVRPSNVSSDKIPIIGLDDDRVYEFEKPELHALQESRIAVAGISAAAIKRGLATSERTVRKSGKTSESASVYVRGVNIDQDSYVSSRPTMLLNLTAPIEPGPVCASVILHELTHLAQFLSKPVQRYDGAMQREFEAYAVQATLLEEFRVPYSLNTATAATIDQLRLKYLGNDQYEPTEFFMEAFRDQQQIGHIATISASDSW